MTVLVDTNVLLYAIDTSAPHHERASAWLSEQRRAGLCLTWSIVYEFLRVATHPRVFERPLSPEQAWSVVDALLSDGRVDVLSETPRHGAFLRQCLDDAPPVRGNLHHDLHSAALAREHGVSTIATADRHFRLFPWVKVVDPTAG